MKILLDECVTMKLKRHLTSYEVVTVTEVGLQGLKNGKLLSAAEKQGFDILLPIDKNMQFQQNIEQYEVAVVVLDVYRSNIKYLIPLIQNFQERADQFVAGKSYLITADH